MKTRLRSLLSHRASPAIAALMLSMALAGQAKAQCEDDTANPNRVYVAGSSAVKPFVALVAAELRTLPTPITLVYQGAGSCTGVNLLVTSTHTISGTASVWSSAGAETSCTLNAAETVNIGLSDVYATTCPGVTALPSGVADFEGPIQTMVFAVPGGTTNASNRTSISYEAAYLTFGLGHNGGMVAPWTDDANDLYMQVRNSSSGTLQMIATAIDVPAAKWKGQVNANGGALLTALKAAAAASHADASIGILSTDVMDANRDSVKALAYQHKGQDCAYWPDSTPQERDKANVRDGHYMIWGPLHMLTNVDGSGVPTDASAQKVIDYLSGAVIPTTIDLIAVESKGGVVPKCAMAVKRTSEVGPLMSYQPPKSCVCKFETEAAGGVPPTGCHFCNNNNNTGNNSSDCTGSAKKCNFHYCEVQ